MRPPVSAGYSGLAISVRIRRDVRSCGAETNCYLLGSLLYGRGGNTARAALPLGCGRALHQIPTSVGEQSRLIRQGVGYLRHRNGFGNSCAIVEDTKDRFSKVITALCPVSDYPCRAPAVLSGNHRHT